MKLRQWLIALSALAYARRRRRREQPGPQPDGSHHRARLSRSPGDGRLVPPVPADRRAEHLVAVLLVVAALFAAGFVVVYAELEPSTLTNQLLGVCIAGSLACVAAALAVLARRLVVTEELEEDYPEPDPQAQDEVAELVREGAGGITRRRLLVGAAATAGGALGLAGLTPLLSLGPLWDTTPLQATPWHRGRRLVDTGGAPLRAADIEEETFYAAFAEGAEPDEIASLLVLVRMSPSALRLPPGRADWAPEGILAYSRICTHAGCAIELYRKPRFPALEPKPALVCPCHYSTFDPATGATVIFGPAGRPLPQLPLLIDASGYLAAAGNFSERVGPGWWGVREEPS